MPDDADTVRVRRVLFSTPPPRSRQKVFRRTRPLPTTDEYVGYMHAEIGLKVLARTRRERVRRVPNDTPRGPPTEYRSAVTHWVLPQYSATLAPPRARGRVRRVPYDTPWLRYSRPLRDSDPKRGTFENCEYRTILRRDGRLHDFEYLEYRAILRQRAQQPENNAQKNRVQRYPVRRPYSASTAPTRRRPHV